MCVVLPLPDVYISLDLRGDSAMADERRHEENEIVSALEPILRPDSSRFVLFPIRYLSVFEFYKKHLASFWTAEEISFNEDIKHFESMTDDERFFIKHVLAFFAASDGIVNENLNLNFAEEVQIQKHEPFSVYSR